MSFGAPPSRTPYGDQDFIKEDVISQTTTQPTYPGGLQGGQQINNPYQSRSSLQPMAYGQALVPPPQNCVSSHQRPDLQNIAGQIKTLTPEDHIFIRSWRQDSFYYRVLPIVSLGSGALWFFNKSKNLPHKVYQYMLLACSGYVIGKWSYKGEFIRRLETTPLDTPFIRALREMSGAKPSLSSMSELSGDMQPFNNEGWNASDNMTPQDSGTSGMTSYYNQPYTSNYNRQDTTLNSDVDTRDQDSHYGSESKSSTSYEELRAKNRGLLKR